MAEPNLRLAYLFWIPSFFGCAGLHRFYLGKPVSGLFYFFTFGFFGLGTLYDGLTMPHHVRQARLSRRLDRILENETSGRTERVVSPDPASRTKRRRPESVDHVILELADERHGVVTPSRVALAAQISPEKARDKLDTLVGRGFADLQVTRDGLIVYVFPEFLDEEGRRELESLS